jgi:hypothetical protein
VVSVKISSQHLTTGTKISCRQVEISVKMWMYAEKIVGKHIPYLRKENCFSKLKTLKYEESIIDLST